MHKDEKWQLFCENGEALSGEWRSAELDNPREGEDDIVGGAVLFLYRLNDAGELEFLWQKRSELVRHGGKWDYAAGGHVNLGESVVQAMIREAHEEIGAEVDAEDLNLVTVERTYAGMFVWLFVADWTGRECDFHFDDKEVTEVKWVPYAEMGEFRRKYGKDPLKRREATFGAIDQWLKMRGLVQDGDI